MNNLTYKGYTASIEFEADSDVFVGRLAGISDIVVFEADTVKGLKIAFIEAVDDYLEHCENNGKTAQRSFSGKLMLRINPSVHAEVALATELSTAKSMNEFAESALHKEAKAYLESLTPL